MKKLLIALLMVPALARAEFFTGNKLLSLLQSNEVIERVHAIGYIQGVFDANNQVCNRRRFHFDAFLLN